MKVNENISCLIQPAYYLHYDPTLVEYQSDNEIRGPLGKSHPDID